MSKQRILKLNCTQAEVEHRLKQQLRICSPKGIVEENHFKLYKRPTGIIRSRGTLRSYFCFYGQYQQVGKQTAITYQIRPYFTVILVDLILTVVFLSMLLAAIETGESILWTVLGCSFFFLFFHLITWLEQKNCIADFEKRLTTEIHHLK